MVVYAGASGLVLPSTSGAHKADVLAALQRLSAGGSTHGAAGIELAYQEAAKHFIPEGINRVILATDGDFNVGPSSEGELVRIEAKRKAGVFLTVLGFGSGNLQDSRMEQLASNNFRFSAGVASFGMLLRGSKNKGGASLKQVERLVGSALGSDPHGEKAELLDMVQAARRLGLGS